VSAGECARETISPHAVRRGVKAAPLILVQIVQVRILAAEQQAATTTDVD